MTPSIGNLVGAAWYWFDVQRQRLIVVTGTGTGIGKTHLGEAVLLLLRAQGFSTAGLKPIESGVGGDEISDATRLDTAATFHVKHAPYSFATPVSPHLAARWENKDPIVPDTVVAWVNAARNAVDFAFVELPGGLFTPLSDTLGNADIVHALSPDCTVLVASDRLGVLHDVISATRAASAIPLAIGPVVLMAPGAADVSTGTNAAELRRLLPAYPVFSIPRKPATELTTDEGLLCLLSLLTQSSGSDASLR